MKRIQESNNEHHWPRKRQQNVECRRRDLVIRIADWMRNKEEPSYDVECYIGGVFDWNESKSFTLSSGLTKDQVKRQAIEYAQEQIAKLL